MYVVEVCRTVCVPITGFKCHWFAVKSLWYFFALWSFGEDKGPSRDLNWAGRSVTAENDSEAYWRWPKPILAKKYSSLAVFTHIFLSFHPSVLPTSSTCFSPFSPSC